MSRQDRKPAYFVDSDDEEMFLDILIDLQNDPEEAENIFMEIKDDLAGTHLSNKARTLPFAEMSYTNLRYLIIGCQRAGAEIRVKAMATFIYRSRLPERLNKLVTNTRLVEMMHKSLTRNIETIYEWSHVEYKG